MKNRKIIKKYQINEEKERQRLRSAFNSLGHPTFLSKKGNQKEYQNNAHFLDIKTILGEGGAAI